MTTNEAGDCRETGGVIDRVGVTSGDRIGIADKIGSFAGIPKCKGVSEKKSYLFNVSLPSMRSTVVALFIRGEMVIDAVRLSNV